MNTLRRLLCHLFGHPDSRIVWDSIVHPKFGWRRVSIEQCARCRAALNVATIREQVAS